jgi:hypothetical protein
LAGRLGDDLLAYRAKLFDALVAYEQVVQQVERCQRVCNSTRWLSAANAASTWSNLLA